MVDIDWSQLRKDRPMAFSKDKPFVVNPYYNSEHYATQDEALAKAKQRSAKDFEDTPIYKAIQLVKAPIPGDIVVETL